MSFQDLKESGTVSRQESAMLVLILVIRLTLALAVGGVGYSQYGCGGHSPAAIILIVLLVLLVTDNIWAEPDSAWSTVLIASG
jgi:hypothetical protein